MHDRGWRFEGTGNLRYRVQPGALGDAGVSAGAASGPGSDQPGGRPPLADWRRGGGRRAKPGGQPVATGSVRTACEEASPEAIPTHDQAPTGIPQRATEERTCSLTSWHSRMSLWVPPLAG